MRSPKIALVHDYLPTYGGAEQVLAVLHEMYPEAPIYTIFSNVRSADSGQQTAVSDVLSKKFKDAKIITSWFDKLPYREKLMSPLLFLIPLIWASFDFSEYDLVISSASWAITKGFGNGTLKRVQGSAGKPAEICYCHTPPRYLYGYDTSGPWKKYLPVRIYVAIVAHLMRLYDFKRAQKVTQFVANSREVRRRIQKFYRRDSVVIHPPVDLPKLYNQKNARAFFLTGGRLEAAKNFDLIIRTCNELKVPLKIFGQGGEEERLREIAGNSTGMDRNEVGTSSNLVEFVGSVSEEEKYRLMSNCRAFIVAAKDEDFGITPVEAMACGRPVIAYRGGGYVETVVKNQTGVFFDDLTVESLIQAIKKLGKLKINSSECLAQAEKFSKERFIREIRKLVAATS